MRVTRYWLPILIAAFATATVAAGTASRWKALLSGAEEVPPPGVVIVTDGDGLARFKLTDDGKALRFNLRTTDLTSAVTQAHIHIGPRGANGPIVANLAIFGPLDGSGGSVDYDGRLASGFLTTSNLVANPLGIASLDQLLSEIKAGNAYVNVHTLKYRSGEVRGQIAVRAAADTDEDDEDDE